MRTLIIVHLEPYFECGCKDLQTLVKKVVRYSKDFDRVINVHSAQALSDGAAFEQLVAFEQEEWIWGFDAQYYDQDEPGKYVEGVDYIRCNGHEYGEILDWMKSLSKRDSYTLVGGARSECLQDVYDILSHLELKVRIKETLTYN